MQNANQHKKSVFFGALLWRSPVLGLALFFLDDFAHGFGFVFQGGGVHHGGAAQAHGADFAGEGGGGRFDAGGAAADGAAKVGVHVQGGGRGDGVLIGGEEEKLPAFFIPVETDEVADVRLGVLAGGVFLAVGEDGEDDLGGFFSFWLGLQPAVCLLEGASNRIEQGGGPARDVGGGGELGYQGELCGGHGNFVGVVKLDEGETGAPGCIALAFDKLIEGGNGGLTQGFHGAGAVQDVGDFDEVWIHGA